MIDTTTMMAEENEKDRDEGTKRSRGNKKKGSYCDGCGKGPRTIRPSSGDDGTTTTANTATVIELKRCTRCHNAYYHDNICQRNHWPIHRKVCCTNNNDEPKQNQEENATRTATTTSYKQQQQQQQQPSAVEQKQQEQQQEQPFFRIEKRPGRGYCMVAIRPYYPGMLISPPRQVHHEDQRREGSESVSCDGYFVPFVVPPVLVESCRNKRCAYCFGKITTEENKNKKGIKTICNLDTYKVFVCSKLCYDKACCSPDTATIALSWEVSALKGLSSRSPHGGPPKVLSSAIYVYRLLMGVALNLVSWEDEIHTMVGGHCGQQQDNDNSRGEITHVELRSEEEDNDDERHHQKAVVMTVQAMIACTTTTNTFRDGDEGNNSNAIPNDFFKCLRSFTTQDVISVLTVMKLNSFSICCADDENDAPEEPSCVAGFGLYRTACRMNHSCNPNAVQSFTVGRSGILPLLQITACQPIRPNEEICICYIDSAASQPRKHRQRELLKNYKFICTCSKCRAEEEEESV